MTNLRAIELMKCLEIRKEVRMTNIRAIELLKYLEQILDNYYCLNDEGKTAFHMAITALEMFDISESLPSAQTERSRYER